MSFLFIYAALVLLVWRLECHTGTRRRVRLLKEVFNEELQHIRR